ncbi:hypothetical protein J6590_041095 [Homalodisca vitripennis]|nr:hypothetical protein J6590_041095 [Homalodisca vitripennis]
MRAYFKIVGLIKCKSSPREFVSQRGNCEKSKSNFWIVGRRSTPSLTRVADVTLLQGRTSLDFETSIQVLQCEYDDPLSTPRQKKPVSRTVSPRPVPWTYCPPLKNSTEDAGHLVPTFVEVHPHCSSHFQVLPRALVTWYQNSSKDIHTVLVPFASSTEGAGHLVHKFVEGHPHCARPICKFYRGRWSLGTKIRRRTSTLLVPFASSTEGAGHLVQKFVEVHPHCLSHFQVLPRALVTWYINSSKDIHTVLVPFASSTEGSGHLVHKFVEGHPHCARSICKFYRGRWSLGTKICRSTSTLLVPFASSTEGAGHLEIHTVLVPFASSTEGAGHLVHKFVEGHPHCARPICKFYRGRWSLGTKICRSTPTLLVPFASSTEGAGHLVPKFVEGHPHYARPICKFYRGRWSLGTKIRRRTSTLCSSHLQVLPRALVTWYINSSKDIHTVLVQFASSTEDAGHLVPKSKSMSTYTVFGHFQAFLKAYT